MDLSAEQREALDREGFILVEGALDAGWLAQLACAFEAAPAQADGTQHVALSDATPGRDAWRRLESHPVVVAAAGHVLGGPMRVRDLHGRNPLPGYGQQGLHADAVTRAAGDPYSVVTALWMIDAFTEDNGATRLVPGSHRLTRPPPASFAQPLARHPDERVIIGAAGSVLVFNGHLWHSGRRNSSTGPRRAGQMVMVAR